MSESISRVFRPSSARRVVHAKDMTGAAVEDALVLPDQSSKVQFAALTQLLILDDLTLKAEGDRISGSTHFTKEQLAKIMGLARSNLMDEPKKGGKKQKKAGVAPAVCTARVAVSAGGKVQKVEFNITGSSDNGHGFSQPAYFAYDDVAVRFEKMSKRYGNVVNPDEVIRDYGADALRAYLINSPVVRAEPLRFSETGVREVVRTPGPPLDAQLSRRLAAAGLIVRGAGGWLPRNGLVSLMVELL